MALDATKILVGAGVFKITAYVTTGGVGTGIADLGHTLSPLKYSAAYENFDVETERSVGTVLTFPVKVDHTVEVTLGQAELDNLRIALRLGSANLSGTNILYVGDPISQYHQIQMVGPGPAGGTQGRTVTMWKAQVINFDEWSFAKAGVQGLAVKFRLLRDDTVTTDKYFKITDA